MFPEGFGDQDNTTFNTTNDTYTVAYTIPSAKFKPNTNYIVMLQWQIFAPSGSNIAFASKAVHDGSTLSNGEFLGHSKNPNVQPNCMVLTRLSQSATPVPITIEIKNTGGVTPVSLKYVRWVAIDESSIDPNDYSFSQTTTPVQVSATTQIITTTIPITNEDWTIFYCNKLLSDIPFDGATCNVITDFQVSSNTIISSPAQGFNGPGFLGVNRVTTMMLPRTINAPSGTTVGFIGHKQQLSNLPNAITATGSILAIRTAAFQGTTQRASYALLPTINKAIPSGGWSVWHCGWNLNVIDPEVISDGNSLISDPEGTYGPGISPTVGSAPVGYDFRSDNLAPGTYSFVYNDSDIFGNGIQGVFLLKDPFSRFELTNTTNSLLSGGKLRHTTNSSLQDLDVTKSHDSNSLLAFRFESIYTTNSFLALFRVLGHSANSLLWGSFDVSHSSDSFLYDSTIRGTAEFFVGTDFDASGNISDIYNSNDTLCINKMILSKYGWEPTSTQTKTFNKCDIKR